LFGRKGSDLTDLSAAPFVPLSPTIDAGRKTVVPLRHLSIDAPVLLENLNCLTAMGYLDLRQDDLMM